MHAIKSLFEEYSKDTDNIDIEELRKQLEEMHINDYNNSTGDLNEKDGLNCEKCKNKGWIQKLLNGNVTMCACECTERRKIINKAKRSGLGEYLNKHINDYKVTEPWQMRNADKMTQFILDHAKDNTWFVALGTSGSGKTLMCSIIANHLLFNEKRTVFYVTWTDFISRLKRDVMGDRTNEVSEYLDSVKKVDVLFLDELVKKYNETDLKYLIEIINYRYTNNLKTIITSERVLDDLLDIDEATFGRAVEKCEGYLINIPKDRSKNYRLRGLM